MTSYTGRRITVVGLGREGVAVSRFLARAGARVTVSDERDATALAGPIATLQEFDITWSLGGHRPEEALDCDEVVLSPGVDKRSPLVQEARRREIPMSSETEIFLERCPARVVGITGSAGKTTTTTLVGAMLRQGMAPSGRRVFVGGNIGQPLIGCLDEMTADDWAVLELSSFQLEWLRRSPHIAAVTNITPNHLNRHETMEAYIAAKATIVTHQGAGDVAVLNRDEPNAARLAGLAKGRVLYFSLVDNTGAPKTWEGACLDDGHLVLATDGQRMTICAQEELRVPGRHNTANALAASAVASACGVQPADIATAIRAFRGVPHRLQPIATIGDVIYYDDSIATAPERTLAALEAIDRPVVLILGGRDKHLPWEALAEAAVSRCRAAVLIGEAAPLIAARLDAALARCADTSQALLRSTAIVGEASMAAAVARAARLARPGDAVALSPGCTSYDMYRDFEERGDDFAREVERIGRIG